MTATRPTIKDYPPFHPPGWELMYPYTSDLLCLDACRPPASSPTSSYRSVNPAGHPRVGVGLAGPPRQGIRTVYHRWPSPRLPNRGRGEPSISAGQHEVSPAAPGSYLTVPEQGTRPRSHARPILPLLLNPRASDQPVWGHPEGKVAAHHGSFVPSGPERERWYLPRPLLPLLHDSGPRRRSGSRPGPRCPNG